MCPRASGKLCPYRGNKCHGSYRFMKTIGSPYWKQCLELPEQLSSLLESCAGKTSHYNSGRRGPPASLLGGDVLSFDAPTVALRAIVATSCVSPSISMSQERIKKPAVSGSSPPICQGKKRLISIPWHRAEKPSKVLRLMWHRFSGGAWVLWHSGRCCTPRSTVLCVCSQCSSVR